MIVELVGLPASGKSALAKALVGACGAEANRARPLMVMDGVRGIVHAPGICAFLLARAFHSSRSGGRWYLVKHFVLTRIAELGRAVHRERHAPQVLDEGPLQALLSVSATIAADDAYVMCRRTPATHIILCMPDETERAERLSARSYTLRPYMTPAERDAWIVRMQANFEVLAGVLQADPRVRTVRTVEEGERVVTELPTLSKVV